MKKIILEKGREKSLLRRHPWIFSGAIKSVEGKPERGETVDVLSSSNEWLARGSYSPDSQITVRAWTFDKDENIDSDFFRRKIVKALELRQRLPGIGTDFTACRLIGGEADGLPGLIVDRYGDYLAGQFLASGVEKYKATIVEMLIELTACKGFYERSDVAVRLKEGLTETTGTLFGAEPPEKIEIREHALKFYVDVKHGHKTGFYLDQRDNRNYLYKHAAGKTVLNCFSYTGGFGVAAAKGGAAMVTNADTSAPMLALGSENMQLNGIDEKLYENIEADVFCLLRKFRAEGRKFDIIVLDPPKFADSKHHMDKACRGYKDIAILGFQLLNPGGQLYTFSCSGLMTPELFLKITADAALDAGIDAHIVNRFCQAPDHAMSLHFPESHYLKGLLLNI
jgi:23S rRNA (cytosine1962-C5)-methyltransferase